MKREASFTTRFRSYLRAYPMPSSAFELKQTTTDSIPFSALQEHQADALLATKSQTGLLYKAPDDSRSSKPYDLFYLRNAYAWVVIKYPHAFYIIDIDTFLLESKNSKRRSLTSARAKEIATLSVKL